MPYANNVPHLGNIIGCVLSGDVFARFCRSRYGKDNVLYICGTDEHGTTTETKALEMKKSPEEVSSEFHKLHKKIYDWFEISFDHFGRTSSKNNHKVSQEIFLKLDKNGYIIEDELEQLYCEKCNRYLADRFVEGVCPKCGYEHARGDQCDKCSTLLNAVDLINPKCKICGSTPVVKKEKHLFIDLPKIAPKLKSWIDFASKNWSKNAITMTKSWLRDGLKPRCITRNLSWGVKVPKKGYEDKVFYSWFDAPIGYIGITIDLLGDSYNDWWLNPENVLLYQFMGKDNIPFHTIMFPSFLIGTGDNYTLLHQISSTEYLNYEDSKFSKSRGVGVFGDDAMNTGIPADVWRFYLLKNRPETSDTVFTWESFEESVNNELIGNLGNFINRSLTFLFKHCDAVVPKSVLDNDVVAFRDVVEEKTASILELLDRVELRRALQEILLLSKKGNEFFQKRAPWLHKDDKAHFESTIYESLELTRKLAIFIAPFMPSASKRIFDVLKISVQGFNQIDEFIPEGHRINKPVILFSKLDHKFIESLKDRFSEKKIKFKDIDLRVGKIIDIKDHPNADSLYVERIDLGDEVKTVVSGLKKYYSKNDLLNKNVVVVNNLKPSKLRGVKSEAMLLAVGDNDVALLLAPNSKPGSRVYVDSVKPAESFKRISVDEFFKVRLVAVNKNVFFQKHALKTDYEEITLDKNIEGVVR